MYGQLITTLGPQNFNFGLFPSFGQLQSTTKFRKKNKFKKKKKNFSKVDPCGREIVNCKSPICNLQFTASRTLWPDQFRFLPSISLFLKNGFTHLVVRQFANSKSEITTTFFSLSLMLKLALLQIVPRAKNKKSRFQDFQFTICRPQGST